MDKQFEFNLPEHTFEQCFTESFLTEAVLTPAEQAGLKGISVRRRTDFSTGRYCAREALKNAGLHTAEILTGSGNEPLWPPGYTGSISHTGGLAGAVASSKLLSIGLDIEQTGRVKDGMWHLLFRPEEQEFLKSLDKNEQLFYTTLFFSMKESYYKMQYPVTKQFLGFTDVVLEKQSSVFQLRIPGEFSGKHLLPGYTAMHYAMYKEKIITTCFMDR
ncbi:MAG: 4'-phosphopantetheinyl transferase [Bacteroidia bacterium]